MPTIYTVKEVAEMLKVSDMSIYRAVKSGQLPGIKVGGAIRITEEALRDFLKPAEAPKPEPAQPEPRRIVTKIV